MSVGQSGFLLRGGVGFVVGVVLAMQSRLGICRDGSNPREVTSLQWSLTLRVVKRHLPLTTARTILFNWHFERETFYCTLSRDSWTRPLATEKNPHRASQKNRSLDLARVSTDG